MEQSPFERLTRLMTGMGNRRAALSVATVSGLALAAAQQVDDATAKKIETRRGRRGRTGRRGKRGHQGLPAGASATVVTTTCTLPAVGESPGVGDSALCTATCGDGFVAISGGYDGPTFIDAIGYVRGSFPNVESGVPTAWSTEMQFLELGQTFDVTTYVVCVPE